MSFSLHQTKFFVNSILVILNHQLSTLFIPSLSKIPIKGLETVFHNLFCITIDALPFVTSTKKDIVPAKTCMIPKRRGDSREF